MIDPIMKYKMTPATKFLSRNNRGGKNGLGAKANWTRTSKAVSQWRRIETRS